jgi:hypothetical protein
MQRRCDWCDRPYEPKRSNSKYHDPSCRKRANRARRKAAPADPPDTAPQAAEPRVRRAVEAQLAAAGREGSPLAEVAVVLAARIDANTDAAVDTGSALASMARELRATLDAALASAAPRDFVDELRGRREARLRAGGE